MTRPVKRGALHPVEARMLAHLRPALVRAVSARRRVVERVEELRRAQALAKDDSDTVYVEHAQRAKALAESVQALADRTFVEAFCDLYGLAPRDGEDGLEMLLRRSLDVVEGGRGKGGAS